MQKIESHQIVSANQPTVFALKADFFSRVLYRIEIFSAAREWFFLCFFIRL